MTFGLTWLLTLLLIAVSLPIIFIIRVTAFWVFICHLVGPDA